MKDKIRTFGVPYDEKNQFQFLLYSEYNQDGGEVKTKTNAKKACLDHFVISQSNILYSTFQLVLVFVCIFSSFLYLFFAAFRYDVELSHQSHGATHTGFTEHEIENFTKIFYFVEGMYLADFLMQFFVEYYPKDAYDSKKSVKSLELTA